MCWLDNNSKKKVADFFTLLAFKKIGNPRMKVF